MLKQALFSARGQAAVAAIIFVLALAGVVPASAQAPKPAAPPAPAPAPAAGKTAEPAQQQPAPPQAIPVSDVAVQAESALARVRQLENRNRIEDMIVTATEALDSLSRDTAYRFKEMRQAQTMSADLETIRDLEEEWRDMEARASSLTRDLTRSALQLDRDVAELESFGATWEATAKAATDSGAPPEVLERIRDVSNAVGTVKKQVQSDRAKVLALQSRSAEIGARATEARQALDEASGRAVTRLLYRDSPPVWSAAFWQRASFGNFWQEIGANLQNQGYALMEYLDAHQYNLVLHALLLVAVVAVLSSMRSKIDRLCEHDSNLQRARKIYDMPVASALLLAMLVSTWFYPRPPRALWIVVSVLGAAPVMVFARRVIDASFYPVLYAIIGFYLADRIRVIVKPIPGLSSLIALAEAMLILLFVGWLLRTSRQQVHDARAARAAAWRVIRAGAWAALFLVGIALASNAGGYVRLADLILRGVLDSAYTAVVLYALTRAGEGIVQGLLYVPPISRLGMVARHRMMLTQRITRWLKWIAFAGWLALTLQIVGLLRPALDFIQAAWKASATIGSLTLSVGDVLSFFFILWAARKLSRLLRFILEEEVYPKLRLDRGLPNAISTIAQYLVLLPGFVLALGALGIDMTKFTIVAGALTVGVGFGLQNIVNNFVSGLIVLFERPVKVGDTIQIDDVIGRVRHIGFRASIVDSTSGAEVIIPNGKLISDKLTNWTLSNQLRQIIVPVATKSDINVNDFKKLLLEIAQADDMVVDQPPPEVLFTKRGIDAFEFELRVWTDCLDNWLEVRSDLITAINEAMRQREAAAQAPAPAPAK